MRPTRPWAVAGRRPLIGGPMIWNLEFLKFRVLPRRAAIGAEIRVDQGRYTELYVNKVTYAYRLQHGVIQDEICLLTWLNLLAPRYSMGFRTYLLYIIPWYRTSMAGWLASDRFLVPLRPVHGYLSCMSHPLFILIIFILLFSLPGGRCDSCFDAGIRPHLEDNGRLTGHRSFFFLIWLTLAYECYCTPYSVLWSSYMHYMHVHTYVPVHSYHGIFINLLITVSGESGGRRETVAFVAWHDLTLLS